MKKRKPQKDEKPIKTIGQVLFESLSRNGMIMLNRNEMIMLNRNEMIMLNNEWKSLSNFQQMAFEVSAHDVRSIKKKFAPFELLGGTKRF